MGRRARGGGAVPEVIGGREGGPLRRCWAPGRDGAAAAGEDRGEG